ncbi:hypothetical protein [Natrarchaeobius oligotrophus]|uniref:ArsR family transcriptional regulator n=1 Tax=Natrarchaeobius chitinivorans TaxID=1679083 RepID=A0A3N6PLE6_NATCH|nr:hypothetical protein [Natrarchaeobius chitinivorans]RQG99745.1 hypothetical protein EA472_13915 [Natrarchaeobius chitinivorans]
MTIERVRDTKRAGERWDEIFEALSAEPRRQLIATLSNAPAGRRVLLPDAATSSIESVDRDELRLQLMHRHLPVLSEFGFVDWTTDPFCAQRGMRFGEVATVFDALCSHADDVPDHLLAGSERFESTRVE